MTNPINPVFPPPPAHVHFMGLGGISVSALARALLARGYRVSGCDLAPNHQTADLAARGVTVYRGHDSAHLEGVDLLVASAAVRPDNPERLAALARGIVTATAADLLGVLLQGLRTIAVAGTHGKTTTSALVAAILLAAGRDPTAFVGGEVPALGGNVRLGQGRWAVAEADEYDRRFLRLTPSVAVVTNIDADHLDIYGDLAGVIGGFASFVALLPPDGALIACADDRRVVEVSAHASCRVVTYGLVGPAQWRARDITLESDGARFTLDAPGHAPLHIATPLSGRHNVANTLAALAACAEAGVPPEQAARYLPAFAAPRRRQEVKGHARGGALVIDDYAHHPTEIAATLAGLRARYPDRRLRVVFQPHTYTRTRATLTETAASFADADEVAIGEIYAARETDTLGVSGQDVAAAARAAGVHAEYVATLDDAARWLARDAGPDVVLVTMGAGDVWKAGEEVVASDEYNR